LRSFRLGLNFYFDRFLLLGVIAPVFLWPKVPPILLNGPFEFANLHRMLKHTVALGVLLTAVAIFPAARCAAKAGADDTIVDHFFAAVRDGNFNEATKHFSARMKALSPAGLRGSWNQVYANEGRLLGWKIFERQDLLGGHDEIRVQLRFTRATASSFVVVSKAGEITSVIFKQPVMMPPYAKPSIFRSEDVTLGAYNLPGTLTIPKGRGPFPAAVLIQGSGPNDRDETVGASHPFADIADGLSSRGIIVLRYDKRAYARWNLDPPKTTVNDEVIDDAVAAVKLLQARPGVAPDRLFIVGHGLGAALAPEIAKKAGHVAGIVMLAPLGRSLPMLMVEQARLLGQAAPSQLVKMQQQADELSKHKMGLKDTFFGSPASYYYDLESRDEVAMARSLDIPILILHGGRDSQVTDDDIRYWQTGLKGDAKIRTVTIPSLNHLFVVGQGQTTPAEYFAPGHVDASVIGAIASFIDNPTASVASQSSN
jgi:dienelactone hydrolase